MPRLAFPSCLVVPLMLTLFAPTSSSRAAEPLPFDEADVFFELNDTDGDLGIHALVDGEAWKQLTIKDPRSKEILHVAVTGRLRKQGLTELFFESAEPSFDELPPEQFFQRFPEGLYTIEGKALGREMLESQDALTHLMPAPPENVQLNGADVAEDCDVVLLPTVTAPVVLTWDPVTESHSDLGRSGEPIEVVNYQVVIEGEDLELTVDLGPDATAFEVPEDLTEPGAELKFEIVVKEASSGNQTAVESCFVVE